MTFTEPRKSHMPSVAYVSNSWLESPIFTGLLFASMLFATSTLFAADKEDADEGNELHNNRDWTELRFNDGMRVRGMEIGDRMYFGQAKVGGQWGLGIVIDRGEYAYGANNRGLSIMKRF